MTLGALQRVSFLSVRRDPVVLALTFLLPIVFFSVFAWIFGRASSGDAAGKITIAVVDEDNTDTSRRLTRALSELGSLVVKTGPEPGREGPAAGPYDRTGAERDVRQGSLPVAVIIPAGFEATFARVGVAERPLEVVYDSANPVARFTVSGLLHAAASRAAPDRLIGRDLDQLEPFGAPATPEQRATLEGLRPFLRGERPWSEHPRPGAAEVFREPSSGGVVAVREVDVRRERPNMVAYYAASIAVMFMLFSMAGAGGALLGEAEGGTLERILDANVPMATLLGSYFLFSLLLAFVQVWLMFAWGAAVFGLDLFHGNRLAACAIMNLATAAAASAFGLVLATVCRTRAQLSAISTVVILVMSALGGSMVPRFVMPPFMNTVALFTFNGWAIDGYLKIFWYDGPDASLFQVVAGIAPQVGALASLTVICVLLARRFARRWESV